MTTSHTALTSRLQFAWIAATLIIVMAAAGAPSPLYVVYQQRIGFSAITLTVVFAVYAVSLLLALLTVGSLSDFVGRKPVLLAALAVEIVSLVLFLPAHSVAVLVLARLVQGVATGAAMGALGAALVDTQPAGSQLGSLLNSLSPGVGLAAGALGAGVLVQYGPAPTATVYLVLIALVAVVAAGLAVLPEPGRRQPGALASLRPQVHIHAEVRAAFLAAVPLFVASWAVGGLYLSLGGSIAAGIFGLHSHVVGGLVVAAMAGTGALASWLLRNAGAVPTAVSGSAALSLGLVVTLVGIAATSTAVFFLGTVIAGFGFGSSFLGALRSVMVKVAADDRAATLAAVLTLSYLAFSGPAVVAGVAASHVGLRQAAIGYAVVVIVISTAALVVLLARARKAARVPAAAVTPATAPAPCGRTLGVGRS